MFTIFDIIIIVILGVSTITGLMKGLVNILVDVAGFIASIIAAYFAFPYVQFLFIGIVENEIVVSIISALVSYLCCLFIFTLITKQVSKLLAPISRGFFDRISGLVAGFARGLLFSMLIFFSVVVIASGVYVKSENVAQLINQLDPEKYPDWLVRSQTTSYLDGVFKRTIALIPQKNLEEIKLPKNIQDTKEIIEQHNDNAPS